MSILNLILIDFKLILNYFLVLIRSFVNLF